MNALAKISPWLLAAGLWLPTLSWWFPVEGTDARLRRTEALAAAQLTDLAQEPHRMRARNPEWDLMQRMYRVLAFANRALREGDEASVRAIDAIVADTLTTEQKLGANHFLLPYATARPFVDPSGRSLFVEGEIAMMLAAQQIVSPSPAGRRALERRVAVITAQMEAGPNPAAESYPDECWTFCNTVALAALRIADASLGSDHRDLARRWVTWAQKTLVDPGTGLLASSFTHDGHVLDGPEGSTLWMTAHNLRLVDPELARDQYDRARAELSARVLDFGYAREWPGLGGGIGDVDSGPVVPLLGASPGSSGTAVLGAASFDDDVFFDALIRSLELVAAPSRKGGELRYAAAGPMGDAVIFYAHEEGALWRAIQKGHPDELSTR